MLTLPLIAVSAAAFAGDRKYYVLPPAEYDHPYKGQLTWQMARDQQQVRDICPESKFALGALACSLRYPNSCMIVIVRDDEIKKAGFPPDLIKRHEIGHCNGWSSDHKGARPWQDWADPAMAKRANVPLPRLRPVVAEPRKETVATIPPAPPRTLSEILFER